jgi:cysteinyl-tRNA synthetase
MPDYRQEMRDFVQRISAYAKAVDPDFIIIPQNGQELMTQDGSPDGALSMPYLAAIDGVGREDLFYGYEEDNVPTPKPEREYMTGFLDLAEENAIQVLTIDYCCDRAFIDSSYTQNHIRGYISFAANRRGLDTIPPYPVTPYNSNSQDVRSLDEAKNFLYLINPGRFSTREALLDAIRGTNYDLVLIDLFFDNTALTNDEISSLKIKQNGGTRLVICYMSIGEAEDYRYYWQEGWNTAPPVWLAEENPGWRGNYKVRYWDHEWQNLIVGDAGSYLGKILTAGFDGAYLDLIDAFEYFEEKR